MIGVADDKDVLGKADALLRRHQVGSDTGSVPVLTDRFEPVPPPASRAAPAEPPTAEEAELVARVTDAVSARLAMELERRVTHELTPQMDAAIERAVAQLRGELAATVAQAVAEALRAPHVK